MEQTKEQFYNSIVDISKEHAQGIPQFIADHYPEHIKELLEEEKLVKLESRLISEPALRTFYVLPENVEECENRLGLVKC